MKKIILIDGHNLLFRMFYGIPSQIKNYKGKEIKGLIGFIGSLKKIASQFESYSIIVIFDSETSKNDNLKIDSDYKSNRIDYNSIALDDNPFSQLPLIKKSLDYLNILYIEIDNYKADDYIASIIHNNKKYQYIIISTDSDFIQLIDNNIYLYVPRGKNSILYNISEVINKYNISPSKYVLFKSLTGDSSDNIKGVKGIGSITASKILQYSSIKAYIEHNPNSRFSKLLIDNEKTIIKNINLIQMNKNLDTYAIKFEKLQDKIFDYKTYEIIEIINEI